MDVLLRDYLGLNFPHRYLKYCCVYNRFDQFLEAARLPPEAREIRGVYNHCMNSAQQLTLHDTKIQ